MSWLATAVAGAVLDDVMWAFGIDLAKADPPSPLTRQGFDSLVRSLVIALQSATAPARSRALQTALFHLETTWSRLTPDERGRVIDGALRHYVSGVSASITSTASTFRSHAQSIVTSTKTAAGQRHQLPLPGVSPTGDPFDTVDRTVIDHAATAQAHFIRAKSGVISASLSAVARNVVSQGIDAGLDDRDIAKNLIVALRGTEARQDRAYLEVVASIFVARARGFGLLRSFETSGIKAYRLQAVLDARTCFAAGTPVRLGSGNLVPIELVRPGMVVESCRGRLCRVVATLVRPKRTWCTIALSNGKRLRVTPNHPILTRNGWRRAGSIEVGAELIAWSKDLRQLWGLAGSIERRASEVPRLFSAIRYGCEDARSEALVLQRGLSGPAADLRPLPPTVPDAAAVCGSRPGEVLFQGLRRRGSQERCDDRCRSQDLQALRAPLPHEARRGSFGEAKNSLFEGLPDDPAPDSVLRVRCAVQTDEPGCAVLLDRLLSPQQGRDELGNHREGGPDHVRLPIPSGGQDWPLDGGLPDRGERGGRGGRGLLAWKAEDPSEGREEGCGPDPARAHRRPGGRGGASQGSHLRGERLDGLFPIPTKDVLREGCSVRVVAIERELLAQPAPAYDLQVEDDAGFIAEGIVVHNSDCCRFMHGKTFPVRAALDRYFEVSQQPPEEVRNLQPFIRRSGMDDQGVRHLFVRVGSQDVPLAEIRRSGVGRNDDTGAFHQRATESELLRLGCCAPPFHGHCRTTMVPVFGTSVQVPAALPPSAPPVVTPPAAAPTPAAPPPPSAAAPPPGPAPRRPRAPRRTPATVAGPPPPPPPPPPVAPPVAAPARPPAPSFQVGVHALALNSNISKKALADLFQKLATITPGILDFLKREPLTALNIKKSIKGRGANGTYAWGRAGRQIDVRWTRPPGSWANPLTAGSTWSISQVGATSADAAFRTLVHELGHHIHLFDMMPGSRDFLWIEQDIRNVFNARRNNTLTRYASQNHREFWAESFAAYVFEPAELRRFDPDAFALVERVLARRSVVL